MAGKSYWSLIVYFKFIFNASILQAEMHEGRKKGGEMLPSQYLELFLMYQTVWHSSSQIGILNFLN